MSIYLFSELIFRIDNDLKPLLVNYPKLFSNKSSLGYRDCIERLIFLAIYIYETQRVYLL